MILTTNLPNIYPSVILPSPSVPFKWMFPKKLPHQNFLQLLVSLILATFIKVKM